MAGRDDPATLIRLGGSQQATTRTARGHLFAFLAVVADTGQLWSLSSDARPCGSTTTAISRSPETASATITTLSAVYFCGFGFRVRRPFDRGVTSLISSDPRTADTSAGSAKIPT